MYIETSNGISAYILQGAIKNAVRKLKNKARKDVGPTMNQTFSTDITNKQTEKNEVKDINITDDEVKVTETKNRQDRKPKVIVFENLLDEHDVSDITEEK